MYNSCEIPYSDNMLSGCSKFKVVPCNYNSADLALTLRGS